jgi:hypothetical protein
MATYSREDFEKIASAIDKDIADVCQQEKHFEAAAMWYRLDRKAPKRQTPFVIQRRMTQIVNAARRLLKYLQVEDQSQASDVENLSVALLWVPRMRCKSANWLFPKATMARLP